MLMSSTKTPYLKDSTARCTTRHGRRHTRRITDKYEVTIISPSVAPIAIRLQTHRQRLLPRLLQQQRQALHQRKSSEDW